MLRIVVPSLFWLEDKELQSQSIHLKNWNILFKRAEIGFNCHSLKDNKFTKYSNKNNSSLIYNYSDYFYKMLYPNCVGSLADYIANKHGLLNKYSKFLIVEPTNLRLDIDCLLISDPKFLQINEEIAKNIINSINQHFVDILKIHYINDSLWLCAISLELYNSMSTNKRFYSVLDIIGCSIDKYLPSGTNATLFTRVLNEIQMLLFNLPINAHRLDENLPIINSLWFWDKSLDRFLIDGEDKIIMVPNILDFEKYLDQSNQNSLLILDNLYDLYCNQNIYDWLQKVKQYDQIVAKLLVTKLLSGKIDNLEIIIPLNPHINGTISVKISKYDKYKIYRYHNVTKILRDIKKIFI